MLIAGFDTATGIVFEARGGFAAVEVRGGIW